MSPLAGNSSNDPTCVQNMHTACHTHRYSVLSPHTPQMLSFGSLLMEPLCEALLSLSDCVLQDKAKTGGVTVHTASNQGADRAD